MINLNVPRIKQTKNACGPASLLQIMKFFGFNKTLQEILFELNVIPSEFNKYGVSEGEMGIYAINNGFNAHLISYDTNRFDPTWNFSKNIKKKLKQRLNFLRNATDSDFKQNYSSYYKLISTKHILEFINKKNSKISFKPISHKLLHHYLELGIPPLVLVNSTLFYLRKRKYHKKKDDIRGRENGHWVVISGFDKENYIITDPSTKAKKNGIYSIEKDRLLNCIIQYGPVLLIVYPKKK